MKACLESMNDRIARPIRAYSGVLRLVASIALKLFIRGRILRVLDRGRFRFFVFLLLEDFIPIVGKLVELDGEWTRLGSLTVLWLSTHD
jgi:hypothetical protein